MMSLHESVDAVSLAPICESNVDGTKDCSYFAEKLFYALYDSSSGELASTLEKLVCSQRITKFTSNFAQTSSYFRHDAP
jgi:hypothetical protein